VCRSSLKREDFQEVKTKEASIEPSSDEEYAYTIKKKTEHKGNNKNCASAISSALPIVNRSSNVLSGSLNALLLNLFDFQC
jgi:hypothetical protein